MPHTLACRIAGSASWAEVVGAGCGRRYSRGLHGACLVVPQRPARCLPAAQLDPFAPILAGAHGPHSRRSLSWPRPRQVSSPPGHLVSSYGSPLRVAVEEPGDLVVRDYCLLGLNQRGFASGSVENGVIAGTP